jgi:hypothetical protein
MLQEPHADCGVVNEQDPEKVSERFGQEVLLLPRSETQQ